MSPLTNRTTRRRRILLVDDNGNDMAIALRGLRRAGVDGEIAMATDGEEALARLGLSASPKTTALPDLPDVIFLDLKMPGIDGWDVLRSVRSDERTRDIPVVIVSASNLSEDVNHSYELGANSFVTKRYDAADPGGFVGDAARYWLQLNEPPRRSDA